MTDPGATGPWLSAVFGVLAYEDYESGDVVPSMAESITTTDGTNWVLRLRDGVTFTDGTAYDADAVIFNWERHLDPELTSPQAEPVAAIESLTAVDPLTVEIELAEPNTQFDRVIARRLPFVGSPAAIESDLDAFRRDPVGAGPFVLDDYVAEQEATFRRNDSYWDAPRPYVDELVLRRVEDDDQRYNSFIAGQAQLMSLGQGYSKLEAAEDGGYQVFRNTASGGGVGLMLNQTRAPFDDLTARRALASMVDRMQATATLDFGATTPIETLFREGNPYHDASLELPGYDPAEAQELLDEYAADAGEPLAFSIYISEPLSQVGQYYQAQLGDFENLGVSLQPTAPNEYIAGLASGDFDAALFPFVFGDPVDSFRDFLRTGGPLNFGGYSNPELDALIDAAAATTDQDERVEIFRQVQQVVSDDVPYVFLNTNPDVQLATDAVRGIAYAIDGIPRWDQIWLDRA